MVERALGQAPGRELRETYGLILQHSPSLAVRPRAARTRRSPRRDRPRGTGLASRARARLGARRWRRAPDPNAAAKHLAKHFGCPAEYNGSLARVGQWVAVTHGVGPLYDEMHALYARDFTPEPVHGSLAMLPPLLRARNLPCQLLLTTGFDRMLEHAFSDAGEKYDVVSFIALGRDRGKFLYVGADGSSRVIDEPNVEIESGVSRAHAHPEAQRGRRRAVRAVHDSYVVSEDDYIDYLSRSEVSALLPIGLAAHIRRSHLLFLGYGLQEWSPRVFLRRLWGEERTASGRGRSIRNRTASPRSNGGCWRSTCWPWLPRTSARRGATAHRRRADVGAGSVSTRVPTLAERRAPTSPYKGLAPFEDSELDEQLFFGREHEREIIVANVVATRLTVLYGPTGVGKSSVLRAGVARDLRALDDEPLVVVVDTWSEAPAATLAAAVAAAVSMEPGSLSDTIEVAAAQHREIYLLLDQLEEYFVYHGGDAALGDALAELVTRPELSVHVLIAIREDALARLDAFKRRLPGLLANRLQLEHLSRDEGRRAIVGPVERFAALVPEADGLTVEPALVDAVLEGVTPAS